MQIENMKLASLKISFTEYYTWLDRLVTYYKNDNM